LQNEHIYIRKAKNGDMAAFEFLVTAHEKKIYNMAYRYTGNVQDAEDITQEVFLRVFRSLSGFKEESSFSTWIYRITSNVCIDYSRKKPGKTGNLISIDSTDEEGHEIQIRGEAFSPEEEYDKREIREAIADAILKLPDNHRQAIILRDINGLSYDEIAKILDISEGTVKSRIARARGQLCKILTGKGNFFEGVSS